MTAEEAILIGIAVGGLIACTCIALGIWIGGGFDD